VVFNVSKLKFILQLNTTNRCGAIAPIAPIGVVLPLNCSTSPIQQTTPILSAVVALNCLMLIKGWRLKKIEINAKHHMFQARPFD
jgi:hypothetical protein